MIYFFVLADLNNAIILTKHELQYILSMHVLNRSEVTEYFLDKQKFIRFLEQWGIYLSWLNIFFAV
jgi:hypothetical protein